MPPQLRFDQLRAPGGRLVVEYSHHLTSLPVSAQGYGMAWESVAEARDHVQRLREFLRQPEQMVFLGLMGRFAGDQLFGAATRTALQGRILTFDEGSLTAPFTVT